MAVLLEALNVIVRRSSLEEKYPGGAVRYQATCPNKTFCMDARLTRVGFMSPVDVRSFIGRLTSNGLTFFDGHQAVDIVVVDEHQGPTAPCEWFEGGRESRGYSAGWERGTEPGAVICPPNWKLGQSAQLNVMPNEEAGSRLLPLAKIGSLDVLLDFATGKEVYIGRVRERE
jgi:hypothetical protein